MSTSGYSRFSLDVSDIMEDAYERIGRELRSGYDAITARRSLNLLFQDMTNRGVNLWTIEMTTLTLTEGTAEYQLDDDTSDLLPDAVIRRDSKDYPISRIMHDEYLALPDKTRTGRPTEFFLERLRDNPVLTLWPVPENSTDQFIAWRIRYMEDVDDSSQTPDMPRRFLPAIISGLAFYLAMKTPGISTPDKAALKAQYVDDLTIAMTEDRDRGSVRLVPRFR